MTSPHAPQLRAARRPLAPGDIVHGFAHGLFGRDSYHCRTVEARAADWAVTRVIDDIAYGPTIELLTGDDLTTAARIRDEPPDEHCTCPRSQP